MKHDKTAIGKSQERLLAWASFDEADPDGALLAGKYRRGVMRGFSVGVRPRKVAIRSKLPDGHPYKADRGLLLSHLELLEISAVTIPANACALAVRSPEPLALPDLNDLEALRAWVTDNAEAVRAALAHSPAPAPATPPAPAPSPEPATSPDDFWSK